MKELNLKVNGMSCSGCENRIKNVIREIKNVKEVSASHEECKVDIIFTKEVSESVKEDIISKIESMDFEVER